MFPLHPKGWSFHKTDYMKTFEFKSQICTTKDQSERLLALGLKKETADIGLAGDIPIAIEDWKTQDTTLIDSPAWSLHRLMEMITTKRKVMLVHIGDDLFDTLIERIRRLIMDGAFNKDYLEERK